MTIRSMGRVKIITPISPWSNLHKNYTIRNSPFCEQRFCQIFYHYLADQNFRMEHPKTRTKWKLMPLCSVYLENDGHYASQEFPNLNFHKSWTAPLNSLNIMTLGSNFSLELMAIIQKQGHFKCVKQVWWSYINVWWWYQYWENAVLSQFLSHSVSMQRCDAWPI